MESEGEGRKPMAWQAKTVNIRTQGERTEDHPKPCTCSWGIEGEERKKKKKSGKKIIRQTNRNGEGERGRMACRVRGTQTTNNN